MKHSIKIMLGVILGLVVVLGIVLVANGDLLEGRLSLRSKPLPAYDETKVTKIRDKKILPAYDENKVKPRMDNAVDVLVIVDTDDYNITQKNVEDLFKLASDLWLKPKTGIIFNVMDVELVSFSSLTPFPNGDPASFIQYLDLSYFKSEESKSILPEYIVAFDKDKYSNINGGYIGSYVLFWLYDELESGQNINYCNEFPSQKLDKIDIPGAVIDYGHKYAICGYDEDYTTVISNTAINGQCQNQEGISCILKNGYQMCSSMQNNFLAQNLLNCTAKTIVHELLHLYGKDDALDHFGTYKCKENIGEDSYQIISEKTPSESFDSVSIEYADMCPNVWQNFINSKQTCPL